jgi:exopolysaccharide production protein ExoZ
LTIVKAERRPDLDGVRGIAILMVLMVHSSFYAHNLPRFVEDVSFYGVRGVQLFFIASGLTLTLAHQGRALHFGNFAKRRFLRIAPMFYVGAALYLILNAAGGPFRYTSPPRISEVIETLAFIHGWFPNAVNKIVPGGWSIAAEAMFYVAFPALLILRHRPLAMLATLVGSYAVAGATHFALMRILPPGPESQGVAFSFWLCQLPAFALGCWLALEVGYQQCSPRVAAGIATMAATLLIVDSQMRQQTNLLVSISLLGLLVWSLGRARPRWLSHGFLPFLGTISFSVYILHFAVLGSVGPWLRGLGLDGVAIFLLVLTITLVLTIPLAFVTYRYIEQPFMRLGRKRTLAVAGSAGSSHEAQTESMTEGRQASPTRQVTLLN